jgi:hypothetical protein
MTHLLQVLLSLCATAAVVPEAPAPWDAWRVFKQYVRCVDEVPDPGISVQAFSTGGGGTSLCFLRQVVNESEERLEPVGGVVWEVVLSEELEKEVEIWSFDYFSTEAFVDAVEQDPNLARLLVSEPAPAAIYWLQA